MSDDMIMLEGDKKVALFMKGSNPVKLKTNWIKHESKERTKFIWMSKVIKKIKGDAT